MSPVEARASRRKLIAIAITAALLSTMLRAEEPTEKEQPQQPAAEESQPAAEQTQPRPVVFERMRVVGEPNESSRIPGSVSYLNERELQRQRYSDVHRMLSLVPGVNVQEEEGYGLRPNIGMRGSGGERSQKITVMEDGVLISPAPYSAPSAYYFPTAARMEGLEVRKGSSSIRQGPFTTGGVLNLISSSIPSSFGGDIQAAAGQDQNVRARARLGNSSERFGWLVESFKFKTDGFKELDGGGPTGVDLQDHMFKFRVNSSGGARWFQALEVKLGKTEQSGHETYLGLTDADFARTPYRRYAGSQEDSIDTDHEQIQLRYLVRPSDRLDLTTTVYRNDFFRNWHKLEKADGVAIGALFQDPARYGGTLAMVRGELESAPDALAVRNNRRDYFSEGVHAVVGIHPSGAGSRHEIELGLRYHRDEEDRFQEDDRFQMTAGRMILTNPGAPGSQSNRVSGAEAWALFAQDTIELDRWTVTPGVRLEFIDFERLDYGVNDPQRTGFELTRRSNRIEEVIPGIGVHYQLNRFGGLFAGVHRGFAPPGPGATAETDAEESINYEAGYRHAQGTLSWGVTGFFNDFDNLLGTDTIAAGGTGEGDLFNGGEAQSRGLELTLAYDPGKAVRPRLNLPVQFSYTWTESEFRSSFDSAFAGWGDSIAIGDELPYVPEHQAAVAVGWLHGRWSTFANLIYKGRTRTQAGQGPIVPEESTDAFAVVDLSVNYSVRPKLQLFVQARNLTDQLYVVARRPAGARPGLRRTVVSGIGWDF